MKLSFSVQWAFPSSPDAKGFPKGCYIAEVTMDVAGEIETITLETGFASRVEAYDFLFSTYSDIVTRLKIGKTK